MTDLRLYAADGEESLAFVERTLAASDLPAEDVRTSPGRFYVAVEDDHTIEDDHRIESGHRIENGRRVEDDHRIENGHRIEDDHRIENGRRVGVGGLESYGTVGLLRSVAVVPDERGRGLGTALCDALESIATERGVVTLFLLTTTASKFFTERGFERIDRGTVPDSIQRTSEFSDLCPREATCMRKRLDVRTN